MMAPARAEAGFTLIEVMVAFVIAALATVVILQAGFDGTAETALAARYEQAVVRAQSRLASLGRLTPLQPQTLSGDDGGGYAWHLKIARAQTKGRLSLYTIQLTESFGTRQVTLTTAKLAPTQ